MASDHPSQQTSDSTRGRLLLLSAAILWSTSGLFVKCSPIQAIPLELRGPLVACYRVLFAAAVIAPFIRWKNVRLRPTHIGMALSYAAMNMLYVTALTRTTAAAAIFLQYTSTAWAYLFGILLWREWGDRGSRVALIFAMCGITWIVVAEWNGEQLTGNLYALASGLTYAGVVIGLRTLRGEQAAWLVFLNSLVAGLVLLPWVLTFDVVLTPVQWTVIGCLGIFQMGVPYLLFALGVRVVQVSEAALLTLLEAVLNPIWVWIFIGEVAPLSTWIGGMLILAGLVVRYTVFAPKIP
ncbi:MAG: EamA family transporter [Planctomycetaceae bacterium]|nr:EamA family transporter [Planctomycetaceae bacterium]